MLTSISVKPPDYRGCMSLGPRLHGGVKVTGYLNLKVKPKVKNNKTKKDGNTTSTVAFLLNYFGLF